MHMERHKFTILELLVVISIIMILSSLLLPALGRAKAAAKMTQCAGNLKQIAILMTQYIDENNSIYPLCYNPDDTYPFWGGKLAASGNLKALEVFVCPSIDRGTVNPDIMRTSLSLESKMTSTVLAYVSYGINRYGTSPSKSDVDGVYKAVKAVGLPADMMLAIDMEMTTQPYDGWYLSSHDAFWDGGAAASSASLLSRHNGLFNLLYADGHVAPLRFRELQFSTADASKMSPWYHAKYSKE